MHPPPPLGVSINTMLINAPKPGHVEAIKPAVAAFAPSASSATEANAAAAARIAAAMAQADAAQAQPAEPRQPLDPRDFPHPPGYSSKIPPTTMDNVIHVLKRYKIKVGYDVIRKRLKHKIPGLSIARDNADNVALTEIISACVLNNMQPGLIPGYVDAIADRNRINPVKDWILSHAWDGIDRLQAMQDTIKVCDDFPVELRDLLIRKWLLSAVAAALLEEGFRCRGVLTLQGDQSIGKTSWILSLLPETLRAELLKIDHHLDPNNKDSILTAISHWIVEIGELDSSFKKDVARLKGFLTSIGDKVRRPYAKADSEYARRTVFCATVNHSHFLVDMTGNTRWWTLPVVAIDFNHQIDTQQLFAQLAHDFTAGQEWWLTAEEERLLDKQNASHLAVSVIRERLQTYLEKFQDPDTKTGTKMMKPIEVLELLGFETPTNPQMKECAEVMRELLGPSTRSGANRWPVPIELNVRWEQVPAKPQPPEPRVVPVSVATSIDPKACSN